MSFWNHFKSTNMEDNITTVITPRIERVNTPYNTPNNTPNNTPISTPINTSRNNLKPPPISTPINSPINSPISIPRNNLKSTSIIDPVDNSILKNNQKNNQKNNPNKQKAPEKDKKIDCGGMNIIICQRGAKINVDDIICNKLIKHFSISVPQLGGYIKKVSNHKLLPGLTQILFPRFGTINYAKEHFKNYNIINQIKSGNRPILPFKWEGKFTDNQHIIVKAIMSTYFNDDSIHNATGGVILNLEAGRGKSFVAAGLIEKINRKTLIVCHTISILNQWIKLLKQAYPNNIISHYYGASKENGDICVGVINSLIMDEMYNGNEKVHALDFFKPFGFVVFDEIHLYSSKTRKKIYNVCQRKYMMGLSATPDENKDGLDKINTWNCGNILNAESLPGYSVDDIPFKGDVSLVKYTGPEEYIKILVNEANGMINHSGMINQLCEDPYRMHMIIKIVFDLRRDGKNIFIFADRRSYLLKLQTYMNLFAVHSHQLLKANDTDTVVALMGGSSADAMDSAKKSAVIILTTYSFMGTGVSIPHMDAIILATPRKSKSRQYVNRIFRLGGDYNSIRKIIDIVDWSTHMKSQWYFRKKYYDEKKYTMITKKILWSEINDELMSLNIKDIDILKILKNCCSDEQPEQPLSSDDLSIALSELEKLIFK